MRWPSRPPGSQRATEGEAEKRAPEAVQLRGEVHPSPGLAALLAGLRPGRGRWLLDLGPAVGRNLEVYSRIASGVRFTDLLADAVDAEGSAVRSPALLPSSLERLLPLDRPLFDVVLAWDLLNYLDPRETSAVVERLIRVCRPGAALHAMVYTGDQMPGRPLRCVLEAADAVRVEPLSEDRLPAPDLPPAEVERRLQGFRVERSFVLRHGVREYVAVLGG